jgi:hypothetical protein
MQPLAMRVALFGRHAADYARVMQAGTLDGVLPSRPSTIVTLALVLAGIACVHHSKPTADAPAGDTDCGDIPDVNDVCPLVDGCPGAKSEGSASEDTDGCPGASGIPYAINCPGDERRFAAIADEIRRRPKLTMLRIESSVPGCADAVRDGLARAGVPPKTIESTTRDGNAHCAPWAGFQIAAWDGSRCAPAHE